MSEEEVAAGTTEAAETEEQEVEQSDPAEKLFGKGGDETDSAEAKESSTDEEESDSEEVEAAGQYEFEVDDDEPITDDNLEEIAAYAKEHEMSQEDAQKLVDMQSQALQGFQKKLTADFEKTRDDWKVQSKADQEIGGEQFGENMELAKRVIDKFGSEEFKTAVNDTGFGNHPELLRVFTRIGKAMANDSLVLSGKESVKAKSMEDVFYGGD
jgi:hypothetical protein